MMNTTMAPMDQAREDNVADLERLHHDNNEVPFIRRSDGGNSGGGGNSFGGGSGGGGESGDGKRASSGSGSGGGSGSNGGSNSRSGSNSNSRGSGGGSSNSGSNNNGGSSGNGNGSGNGSGNSGNGNGNGNGNGGRKALNPPDDSSSKETLAPSEPLETTAIAVTTVPTTVVVTSTTGAAAAPSEVSDASLTLFPTTTAAPDASTPTSTTPPDSSTQPRKGLNTDGEKTNTSSESMETSTTSTIFVPETVLWPSTTNVALPVRTRSPHSGRRNAISPLTEHLLIAAGAIGAFIIIIAGVYLLSRIKKEDLFSVFRNREFRKSGPRGWYGWRRKTRNLTSLRTSETEFEGYPSDDKSIPSQREPDAFVFPITIPLKASPQKPSALSETDLHRHSIAREAFLANSSPFRVAPPQMTEPINPTFNTLGSNYNNTYNTNTTFLSRNTSGAYDPGQREVNHLSYLSSLSSGFGDAEIIIPESDTAKQTTRGSRKSAYQSRKFSWVSSVPGFRRPGDRDTVYTRSSVESSPRYRTVNSWVAQQTGRVERRQENDREVPNMPVLPSQLQIGVNHQRKESENPAFRHHPGEEVEISRGSRVPSAILDRKTGVS